MHVRLLLTLPQAALIKASKAARQARLVDLYRQEALQYEAELNTLGLALTKRRD
jgi:hypothetical protein